MIVLDLHTKQNQNKNKGVCHNVTLPLNIKIYISSAKRREEL
jgi:hypothetical protein